MASDTGLLPSVKRLQVYVLQVYRLGELSFSCPTDRTGGMTAVRPAVLVHPRRERTSISTRNKQERNPLSCRCACPRLETIVCELAVGSVFFKFRVSLVTHLLPGLGTGVSQRTSVPAPPCHPPGPENHVTEEKPAIM